MSNKAVCRTAPATPGLSTMINPLETGVAQDRFLLNSAKLSCPGSVLSRGPGAGAAKPVFPFPFPVWNTLGEQVFPKTISYDCLV